jgi:hypothetical protein
MVENFTGSVKAQQKYVYLTEVLRLKAMLTVLNQNVSLCSIIPITFGLLDFIT